MVITNVKPLANYWGIINFRFVYNIYLIGYRNSIIIKYKNKKILKNPKSPMLGVYVPYKRTSYTTTNVTWKGQRSTFTQHNSKITKICWWMEMHKCNNHWLFEVRLLFLIHCCNTMSTREQRNYLQGLYSEHHDQSPFRKVRFTKLVLPRIEPRTTLPCALCANV